MGFRQEVRDPWVGAGLALLAALTALTMVLYRSAPTSIGEARARVWSSALPGSFTPRLGQARERFEAASSLAEAGRDSAAVAAFIEAAGHAGAAWELAGDEDEAAAAIMLWADSALRSAELLLRIGTGAGVRPDDDDLLRDAMEWTRQVLDAPVDAATLERATELHGRIERQLRPGPLEWLPPWR